MTYEHRADPIEHKTRARGVAKRAIAVLAGTAVLGTTGYGVYQGEEEITELWDRWRGNQHIIAGAPVQLEQQLAYQANDGIVYRLQLEQCPRDIAKAPVHNTSESVIATSEAGQILPGCFTAWLELSDQEYRPLRLGAIMQFAGIPGETLR